MKTMHRALRQLSGQVTDASKRDENLRLINDMQRGCVLAKGMPVPEGHMGDAADDAAKARVNAEFRRDLMAMLRLMLDAEQAVVDGQGEEARAKLVAIEAIRDAGHKRLGITD